MMRFARAMGIALVAMLSMGQTPVPVVPSSVPTAAPAIADPPPDPKTQVVIVYYDLSTYTDADIPFRFEWKRLSPSRVVDVTAETFARYPGQFALEVCDFRLRDGAVSVPTGCASRRASCYVLPIRPGGATRPECRG